METLNFDGNKVFIDWVSEDVTLEEVDDWVNNIRKDLDPEEEITFACEVCGKNAATFIGPDVQIPSTIDQLKKYYSTRYEQASKIKTCKHYKFYN